MAPTATRSSPSPFHLHWSRHGHLNISVGVWRPRAFALQETDRPTMATSLALLRSLLRIDLLVFWRARQCPGKGSLNLSGEKKCTWRLATQHGSLIKTVWFSTTKVLTLYYMLQSRFPRRDYPKDAWFAAVDDGQIKVAIVRYTMTSEAAWFWSSYAVTTRRVQTSGTRISFCRINSDIRDDSLAGHRSKKCSSVVHRKVTIKQRTKPVTCAIYS